MTVASPAPKIPKFKPKIKIESRIMFKTAVKISGFVALLTSPSALKILAVTLGARNTIFIEPLRPVEVGDSRAVSLL